MPAGPIPRTAQRNTGMSRSIVVLASVSAALLAAAVGIVLLLLWQSWEDGRRMEQRNRELQASLEASRIRVENFCEYPMEALCPVDTQGGRSGAVLPPADIPMPSDPAQGPLPMKSAPGQTSPSAGLPAEMPDHGDNAFSGQLPPVPDSRPNTEEQEVSAEQPGNADQSGIPALSYARQDIPGENIPEREVPSTPVQTTDTGSQTAPSEQNTPSASLPQPAEQDGSPAVPPPAASDAHDADTAPVPPAEPKPQEPQQIPIIQTAPQDAPPPAGENASAEPPAQERPRRTWTTLDQGKDGMLFRIAGAGDALRARGDLLPGKYVVTIEGAWNIVQRMPSTPCVQGMLRSYAEGNTVLEFPLRRPPETCRVLQENERTIAIEIR